MKIYLGADHWGYELKEKIAVYLAKRNYILEDVGASEFDKNDDFPIYASKAALKVIGSSGDDPRAILICYSGQGVAIAANRFNSIRAVVISNIEDAKLSRNDDDANVLCLSANRFNDNDEWQKIIDTWLKTPFDNGERFKRRNTQLDNLR